MKKSPMVLAQELVSQIGTYELIAGMKASGPYLNFTLNKTAVAAGILAEIEAAKEKYGCNNLGHGQQVMIEFSNANTHKEYHVGHLRNIAYGDSVAKILVANGYNVLPVSYINDFGIHAAKTLWAYKKFAPETIDKDKRGYLLGQLYARASKELAEHPEYKDEIGAIMQQLESRQGEYYKLWQETRQWSIEQFAKIYDQLGVKFVKIYYESEVIAHGLDIVTDLATKDVLVQSEGALIADLQEDKLGVLPILRSDGTALYPVADLALAIKKFEEYDLALSLYVVDVRQSLYFKQLFRLLELAGYRQKTAHLPYEFVKLPDGMMSSRSGRIIAYEDLNKEAVDKAFRETKLRHQDWSAEDVEAAAQVLATGALKFEMIKVGADKTITFDMDSALQFEGFTAGYLQYAVARINSLLEKFSPTAEIDYAVLDQALEKQLLLCLAQYPGCLAKAAAAYQPSEIAKYLFSLAQLFNDYYHQVNIGQAEDAVRAARLAMAKAVRQVLSNGLELLGIATVKQM